MPTPAPAPANRSFISRLKDVLLEVAKLQNPRVDSLIAGVVVVVVASVAGVSLSAASVAGVLAAIGLVAETLTHA